MLKTSAILYFGSASALARALDITAAAVSDWGEIVPEGKAYKLQVLTAGALQVDPSMYEKRTAGGADNA